jgi:hypothetical protein
MLGDNDRFQTIKKLDGKLVVEIPESIIRYFGLEENVALDFTIDKERIIIKESKTPLFRAA